MIQMLGFFGPLLILWILLGVAAALIRRNPRSLAFIVCGVLLTILSGAIIVLGGVRQYFVRPDLAAVVFVRSCFRNRRGQPIGEA